MTLQIQFGIIGAALGLVIAIIGGLVSGIPFGIVILRALLSALITGVLGIVLFQVIKSFLPELVESTETDEGDGLLENRRVDIVLPGDELSSASSGTMPMSGADQAEPLRRMAKTYSEDDGEQDDSIIQEVSEDRRARSLSGESEIDPGFNEAAFYQGVERLPDIGGFTEQFQEKDSDGTITGNGTSSEFVPDSGTAGSSSKRSGSGQNNMDPALIAQAIRTALKKDDQ